MNRWVRWLLSWLVVAAVIPAGCARTEPREVSASPSAAPLALRLAEGDLGVFDGATQRYAPQRPGFEPSADQPLQSGDRDAVLRCSDGGFVVAAPHTSFTRLDATGGARLRWSLDEGRLWLKLGAEEQAEVRSFHTRVTMGAGVYEIKVYKDADSFVNTVVRAYEGRGSVRGGERLQLERPLAPGLTVHADDIHLHPVRRFDPRDLDVWQKRMRATR